MARKLQMNVDNCADFIREVLTTAAMPQDAQEGLEKILDGHISATASFLNGLRSSVEAFGNDRLQNAALIMGILLGTILARASDSQEFEEILAKLQSLPENITPIQAAKNWGKL